MPTQIKRKAQESPARELSLLLVKNIRWSNTLAGVIGLEEKTGAV